MAQSKAEVIANAVLTIENIIQDVCNNHLLMLDEDSQQSWNKSQTIFKQFRRTFYCHYNIKLDQLFKQNKTWHKEHDFENKVKQFIENNRDKKICMEFKNDCYNDEKDRFYITDAKDIQFDESPLGLSILIESSLWCCVSSHVKRIWVLEVENKD